MKNLIIYKGNMCSVMTDEHPRNVCERLNWPIENCLIRPVDQDPVPYLKLKTLDGTEAIIYPNFISHIQFKPDEITIFMVGGRELRFSPAARKIIADFCPGRE